MKSSTDCVPSCIASLLEIPLKSIPEFHKLLNGYEDGSSELEKYPAWYRGMQDFLSEWGLQLIEIKLIKEQQFPALPHGVMCILFGHLDSGSKHAIVGQIKDGELYPFFDPMSGDPDNFDSIEGVGLLVPTDVSKVIRKESALLEIIEYCKAISNPTIAQAVKNIALEALGREEETKSLIVMPDAK